MLYNLLLNTYIKVEMYLTVHDNKKSVENQF